MRLYGVASLQATTMTTSNSSDYIVVVAVVVYVQSVIFVQLNQVNLHLPVKLYATLTVIALTFLLNASEVIVSEF